MKMYMLRNSDGLYLNTDYHTRWQQGNWRPREQARLYKSKQGIRSALAGIAFPAMKAHLGIENPAPPFGTMWSDVDRECCLQGETRTEVVSSGLA